MQIAKRQGIAVVLCLLLLGAGCSGGGSKKEGGSASKAPAGANDIVPTDRADLAAGGKLVWPIDRLLVCQIVFVKSNRYPKPLKSK